MKQQNLLQKFADGSATHDEKLLFQQQLQSLSDEDYKNLLSDYEQLMLNQPATETYDSDLLDKLHRYIASYETPVRSIKTTRNNWMKYAVAAVALTAVITTFFLFRNKAQGSVLATELGERKSLRLPDGTQVILNGAGTLTLASDFNGKDREVTLSGEAYFDVTHNADKPFIVHTATMDVRVVGTAFNVRSYADETNDETSLIRGKIRVTLNKPIDNQAKTFDLTPMQKIVVAKTNDKQASTLNNTVVPALHIDSLHINSKINTVPETAWIANRLVFEDENLESVARKIEKWYGVEVVFENNALKTIPYTGSFDNQNLEKVLETIRYSIPTLHFKIENNKKLTIY